LNRPFHVKQRGNGVGLNRQMQTRRIDELTRVLRKG